jgi:hypothetical protein
MLDGGAVRRGASKARAEWLGEWPLGARWCYDGEVQQYVSEEPKWLGEAGYLVVRLVAANAARVDCVGE